MLHVTMDSRLDAQRTDCDTFGVHARSSVRRFQVKCFYERLDPYRRNENSIRVYPYNGRPSAKSSIRLNLTTGKVRIEISSELSRRQCALQAIQL